MSTLEHNTGLNGHFTSIFKALTDMMQDKLTQDFCHLTLNKHTST